VLWLAYLLEQSRCQFPHTNNYADTIHDRSDYNGEESYIRCGAPLNAEKRGQYATDCGNGDDGRSKNSEQASETEDDPDGRSKHESENSASSLSRPR